MRLSYMTLPEVYTAEAIEYLRRADAYRKAGYSSHAMGCERKALRKFAKSYGLRNWRIAV